MKLFRWALPWVLSVAALAQSTGAGARPKASSARQPGACDCAGLSAMVEATIQAQQEEAADLQNQINGMRSLTTMLRSDAGAVQDPYIRDGLQVDAEIWDLHMSMLQKHIARLQHLVEQERASLKTAAAKPQ